MPGGLAGAPGARARFSFSTVVKTTGQFQSNFAVVVSDLIEVEVNASTAAGQTAFSVIEMVWTDLESVVVTGANRDVLRLPERGIALAGLVDLSEFVFGQIVV